jgi:hypothetical protein
MRTNECHDENTAEVHCVELPSPARFIDSLTVSSPVGSRTPPGHARWPSLQRWMFTGIRALLENLQPAGQEALSGGTLARRGSHLNLR